MLCRAVLPPVTVGPQSGEPMPHLIDHLVICVHDLAQAALDWQTLGFNLTPTGAHPLGTSNPLPLPANNPLPPPPPPHPAPLPPAPPPPPPSPPPPPAPPP